MYLGVDIGGTNLAVGITDEGGNVLYRTSVPADIRMTDTELVCAVAQLCRSAIGESGVAPDNITAAGVGIPGAVDNKAGIICQTPNLPFKNTPFRAIFQKELNIPVLLGNDANCAAVAEYYVGAAKGTSTALTVTLGTGVGGGYISDGKLITGVAGTAFEIGHMITHVGGHRCGCGKLGCWEQYASATALIRMGRGEIHGSMMSELCAGDPSRLTGSDIFKAAEVGDAAAVRVLDGYLDELAAGLVSLINILQPEVICLCGGISHASDELLYSPLRERVKAGIYDSGYPVKIRRSQLGNDAGIIGAAMLCKLNH